MFVADGSWRQARGWLARHPPYKSSEMHDFVMEKHTFLLLADPDGRHVAGWRAPP